MTHYSAAESNELKQTVENIVDQRATQTPTLTCVGRMPPVGKCQKKASECCSVTLLKVGVPSETDFELTPRHPYDQCILLSTTLFVATRTDVSN